MKTSKPTIRDVANLAGVSHQTVSRVINQDPHVLPDTKQKVLEAINQINFKPNAIARSMASGRSNMLALITPNLVDVTFANAHEGAEFELRQKGFFLITSSSSTEEEFSELIEELIGHKRVDGVLLFNPYIDRRHTRLPKDFPLVYIGGRERDDILYSVYLDNRAASTEAALHLINLGHKVIAHISGPRSEDCAQERYKGFEDAITKSGLTLTQSLIDEGDWSATSGYEIFNKWLQRGTVPSGVVVQNDRMAVGVLRAARDAGIKVPEQLSVIGFDDMPLGSYFDPPLTTMRQDTYEIGRRAASLLLKVIQTGQTRPVHERFLADLIVRNTTAKPERR